MTKAHFVSRVAQSFVKLKVMSAVEAESFEKEFSGRTSDRVDEFLLDEGIVDRETFLKVLQSVYGVSSYDVRGYFFNHQILMLFPKDFLENKAIIPLDIEDDILTVVASNPEDDEILSVIGNYVPYSVNVMVGIKRDILEAIEEYYDEDVVTSDIEDEESEETDELSEDESDIIDIY
jgi:hypothetical protein